MRNWKHEVQTRLANISLSPGEEAEIVEEVAQHLADRCEDLQSGGMSESQAEQTVIMELEQIDLARELRRVEGSYREPVPWGQSSFGNWLESLWQDLRYGVRVLRINPAFTLVCLLSLSLGIGVNTAIFQLIDAVRMRVLPVWDPQQLAIVHIADRK